MKLTSLEREKQNGVRYTKFLLLDGYCSDLTSVLESGPYGPYWRTETIECREYIQRMIDSLNSMLQLPTPEVDTILN
jgi:hypothetical protein